MGEKMPSVEPTATSLKKELRESLEILKRDFDSLNHFVAELTSDGNSTPISLTNDDLQDLLSVAQEIQDAASDIEFEAGKIKEKISRFVA
jgi:prefoldin subunit 5